MTRAILGRVAVVAAIAAASVGCRDPRLQNKGCRQDSDCGDPAAAYRCDTQAGVCYCRTNQGCTPREFCNTQGFCQDRSGCEKNDDCADPSLFCDTTTGSCLSRGRCSIDLHCDLGYICDVSRATCVEGCRTSGDCKFASCRCGEAACQCSATTQAELNACAVGICDSNFCADDSFCAFGQLCGIQPDAGQTLNQCYSDYDAIRRPYCATCGVGGGTDTCGRGANYCLIDTTNGGSFCGADCSAGQTCPRGYRCSDVIVVYRQWQCSRTSGCAINQAYSCNSDSDCTGPRGGVTLRGGFCAKLDGGSGFCAPRCSIDEGDSIGFCSCLIDSDCAQESCSSGECSISRKPCTKAEDCRSIRCVDFRGAGGCLIGQNCAPGEGLTCVQVKQ